MEPWSWDTGSGLDAARECGCRTGSRHSSPTAIPAGTLCLEMCTRSSTPGQLCTCPSLKHKQEDCGFAIACGGRCFGCVKTLALSFRQARKAASDFSYGDCAGSFTGASPRGRREYEAAEVSG